MGGWFSTAKLKAAALLVACCGICLAVGVTGSFFVSSDSQWYRDLNKPFFMPPDWTFGVVWTALYILMGVALFLFIRSPANRCRKKAGLVIFAVQLILNGLWSPLFFGLQSTLLGFAGAYLLWLFVVVLIVYFWRTNRASGLLLIPYLLWVSFAAVLSTAIFMMNS